MANLESLHGSDKLREAYPKVNRNFNAVDKEVTDLRTRVNTIITTPIDGEAAAQELIDARQGEPTLGDNLTGIKQTMGPLASLITRIKTSIVNALNGLQEDFTAHKAEKASDDVHGLAFKGAVTQLNTNVSIATATKVRVPFAGVIIDTSGFFNVAYPTRLTVPGGISKVKLNCNIEFDDATSGRKYAQILKNGSLFAGTGRSDLPNISGTSNCLSAETAIIDVSAGDYFEVEVYQNSSAPIDVIYINGRTWLCLEVIE